MIKITINGFPLRVPPHAQITEENCDATVKKVVEKNMRGLKAHYSNIVAVYSDGEVKIYGSPKSDFYIYIWNFISAHIDSVSVLPSSNLILLRHIVISRHQ